MHYKLSPLILTPGQASGFISEVYVTQPDARKEAACGRVFIIIEIESKRAEDLKIVNFLIENFCENYYQSDKILLREKTKTVQIEHVFESALATTNKKLLEFLHQEKIKFSPETINATIGVIFENDIHFASIGKNKALLLYNDKKENAYKIADVIEYAKEGSEKKQHINVAKLFSSVVSGNIPKNGYFIFSNEALPEYLTNSQLIKIITTLPPISAAEQIKKTLSSINNYIPFLGLIIKNTLGVPSETSAINKAEAKNHSSSTHTSTGPRINNIEQSTEKILTTKGIINFKNWGVIIANLFSSLKKQITGKNSSNQRLLQLKDRIFFKKRTTKFSLNKAFSVIKDIASLLIQSSKLILTAIKKPFKSKETKKASLTSRVTIKQTKKDSSIKEKLINIADAAIYSSRRTKFLAGAVVICIVLFSLNTAKVEQEKTQITIKEDSTELINKIAQKQNQVEANLLYNNENNAKTIISEINELIQKLPKTTKEEITKYEELNAIHTEQLDKIRRASDIDSAKKIADFSEINTAADPVNIIISGSTIYVGDSKQKTIYMLDLGDNLKTALVETKEEISNLKYPIKNTSDDIYYLNDDKSIVKLKTSDNTISILPINLKNINYESIKGGAGFGTRLYYVSREDNQIFRFNASNKGFPSSTKWIKDDEIDIKNAIDIEIDGSIFVLKANGEIIEMMRGKQQDFTLDKVEPELKMATKFFVSPELEFIYILDPLQKRLVIFNKKGEFIAQYTSKNFNNLKDFVVDEDNKTLYFLDTNSIYKISATHL